ncbi:hypothetical protein COCCADRAFT_101411, partial [Bipolaris zeicola 26-R-13]
NIRYVSSSLSRTITYPYQSTIDQVSNHHLLAASTKKERREKKKSHGKSSCHMLSTWYK